MTSTTLRKLSVAAAALCVTGCATAPGQQGVFADTFNNPDPCANNARNTGIVVGTLAGALIGAKLGDKDKGAMLAGALLGGAVGGVVGADIDGRRCALHKVAQEYQLQMQFAAVTTNGTVMSDAQMQRSGNGDALKKNAIGNTVSFQDGGAEGGHFDSNSAVLTTRAERYFSAIADIYNLDKAAQSIANPSEKQRVLASGAQRKLLLVGHTDDTGSSALNADLSERRARAVAEYLERRGIPRDQVYYQGAGEVYPIADNRLDDGRQQNRRVEIVELADAASLDKYLAARRPEYRFYRPVDQVAAAQPASRAASPGATVAAKGAAKAPATRLARAPAAKPKTPATAAKAPARSVAAVPSRKSAAPASAPATATAAPALASTASAPQYRTVGTALDFGGAPLGRGTSGAPVGLGKVETARPLFSLVSNAYADDVAVLSDCSQDRPRSAGGVKALKDGATYRINEHVPGLYGKTWTERVNGHQVVINKVAVLATEATLAQTPELKVYANYQPATNRNPTPDVTIRPAVNTYLGENGILYRIFTDGAAGMQCVDILYARNGGSTARGGNIVYARDNRLFVSPFKPVIAN